MDDRELLLPTSENNYKKAAVPEQRDTLDHNNLINENNILKNRLNEQMKINEKLKTQIDSFQVETKKLEDINDVRSVLQNLLESSIEYSIIGLDMKGLIIFWNRGAEHNYGFTAKEVVKNSYINLLHLPEDITSGKVQAFFDTATRLGAADEIFERVRKDKTRFTASVNASLRKNEVGVPIGFVVISKDITESKATEEQLLKSYQELEQFAYITSHDLKAPLRAIERLASWIEDDNQDILDEQSKKNLILLRKRTHRMSNLIDGILQYSRAGRTDLDLHQVNSRDLLREVIDSLDLNKKFIITVADNMPTFTAAKVPLSQVFANLLSNGIKHHDKKAGKIEIGVTDVGNFYRFYVKDDGPGIEAEYFEKIFQIFQTLKSRDELEATGIGLSIVKKIVESQKGKVFLESTVGEGSTFYFTWPKYPQVQRIEQTTKG
jgi:PAS domain S-box-containing protein